MFGIELIKAKRREIELADAVVGFVLALELVAHGERVVGADLIVQSRAQVCACAGVVHRSTEWHDREGRWIHDLGADDGQFINVTALEVEEE